MCQLTKSSANNKIRCQQKQKQICLCGSKFHISQSEILQSDMLTLFVGAGRSRGAHGAGAGGERPTLRGQAWPRGQRAGRGRRAALAAARSRASPGKAPEEANGPGTTRAARAQEPLTQRGGGATTSSRTPPARTAAQHSAHAAGVKMTCSIESVKTFEGTLGA